MTDPYAHYPDHLHPAKNFKPRQNPPKADVKPPEPLVDPTNIDAVKAMVWEKLVKLAQAMPISEKALPVYRELIDRLDGRPVQRIDQRLQQVGRGGAGDMSNAELLAEIRKLGAAGSLPSGVTMLENGQLEISDAEYSDS